MRAQYNASWFKALIAITVALLLTINALSWTLNRDGLRYETTQRPQQQPHQQRIILLWNPFFSRRDYYFGLGTEVFFDSGCTHVDCHITDDRSRLSEADAVVFHGPEFNPLDFNATRNAHQVFFYLSMESPMNRPLKSANNGFFNATITYRLDSDVRLPYFYFRDVKRDKIIAPAISPPWIAPDYTTVDRYNNLFDSKSKPVAWFSSNCRSHSDREARVRELQRLLKVDVYGSCGPFKCPRSEQQRCFDMLKKDYYFYLSYENSLCDDYITEKAANAYRYDAVPIVFSGANLTRHLPPDSYIDARSMSTEELADKIKRLMANRDEYVKYFWWKDHYRPTMGEVYAIPTFCRLCEILDTNNAPKEKTYKNLVKWWHGGDENPRCVKVR